MVSRPGNRLSLAQRRVLAAIVEGVDSLESVAVAVDRPTRTVQRTLDALTRRNLITPVAAFPSPDRYVARPRAIRVLAAQGDV